MQKNAIIFTFIASSFILAGCGTSTTSSNQENNLKLSDQTSTLQTKPQETMKKIEDFEKIDAKFATISTNKGDIEVELYPEMAPVTVASFLDLAKKKFYDGIIVHRVEPGFVIQVGDPQTKEKGTESLWGTGGPGYTIPDEFSSTFKYDQAGILAMAKTQMPNSGGSQFFITLGPAEFLNGSYTVFGKVTKGLDIVKSITVGDSLKTITFK